jgi:hypothetical protein
MRLFTEFDVELNVEPRMLRKDVLLILEDIFQHFVTCLKSLHRLCQFSLVLLVPKAVITNLSRENDRF